LDQTVSIVEKSGFSGREQKPKETNRADSCPCAASYYVMHDLAIWNIYDLSLAVWAFIATGSLKMGLVCNGHEF